MLNACTVPVVPLWTYRNCPPEAAESVAPGMLDAAIALTRTTGSS